MSPCVISTASRKSTRSPISARCICASDAVEAGNVGHWAEANCGVATRTATAIRAPLKRLIMRTEQKKAGSRRITSAFAARNRRLRRTSRVTNRARPRRCRRGDCRREKSILLRRRPGNTSTHASSARAGSGSTSIFAPGRACARSPPAPRQYAPAACQARVITIVEAAGSSAFSISDTSLSRSAPNTIGSGSGNSRFR